MLDKLMPYLLYIKCAIVLIIIFYIGWLKYCLIYAKSDLQEEQAKTTLLKARLNDYTIAYDTLAKKTAEQNAQINAMSEETTKAIQRAEQAKNNALGKLKTRDKQLSSIKAESTTCEQSIQRAKDELKGSLL